MSKENDPRDDANYRDAPEDIEQALGSGMRIEDTLPSPEELVRKKQPGTHSFGRRYRSVVQGTRWAVSDAHQRGVAALQRPFRWSASRLKRLINVRCGPEGEAPATGPGNDLDDSRARNDHRTSSHECLRISSGTRRFHLETSLHPDRTLRIR